MAGFELGAPQMTISQPTCSGAADLLVAARPTRMRLLITNLTAGADAYIGNSNSDATNGYLLAQGDSLVLETTAALYGFTSAGTATFHVIELHQ